MRYHDNEVYINVSPDSKYRITGGSYKIKSFSITSGQDPDNNIRRGVEIPLGKDGKMSFRLGRKGDDSVATWFKSEVKANRTTFNDIPDDLNFAFSGKLKLTLEGGILGNESETFVLDDIVIAQGHKWGSNNWWFGGKNCKYIGKKTVSCSCSSSTGMVMDFKFLRGGNDVDEIEADPVFGLTSNWMSFLDDSVKLGQLMMPASHDAGMCKVEHCAPPFTEPYTQTQCISIGSQLAAGSRYFDIRGDFDHGELVTYHRTNAFGGNGQSFKSVFDDARSFLKENNEEVAIFRISHIRDYGDDHKPEEIKKKINSFIEEYSDIIYVNSTKNINLVNVPLGDLRGKLVLVFNYPEYIDPSTGRFRYKDGDGASASQDANLTVYDSYAGTDDYYEMKKDQLDKWDKCGQGKKDFCFLLSWTLTSTKPPLTAPIESLANKANSKVAQVLRKKIKEQNWSWPNFVYLDYITPAVTEDTIIYNLSGELPLKKKLGND
jgi:hypothetical protein